MKEIRKGTTADIDRIMEIYRSAQDMMIAAGNETQWGHSYPDRKLISRDIESGICMVICEDGKVRGVFAMCGGDEPTYEKIYGGSWMNDEPYITIHRLAGDGTAKGLFKAAADHCKERAASLRVDTHENNRVMQRLAEKNGFSERGIIYVADGSPRIAYQWVK